MKLLAVDVGGSHITCAAVENHTVLESFRLDTNSTVRLTDLLPALATGFLRLIPEYGGGFAGIAFGFCGLVDSKEGRIVSTNHKYSDATSVDLVSWADQEFGLPLILENDARLALLGECYAGVAQGSTDLVMMTLGTGIGTAAMMEGRLLRGKHSQAGCLGGHFTFVQGGRLCSCGARGCFEAEASTYALPGVCRSWPGFESSALAHEDRLDFMSLFHWADRKDKVAEEVRERCLRTWSACALSLVHAYDPDLLVLGGGVMKSSYPILRTIQEHVNSYAWTPWGKVQFGAAALGNDAALLGAVPLFSKRDDGVR